MKYVLLINLLMYVRVKLDAMDDIFDFVWKYMVFFNLSSGKLSLVELFNGNWWY